MRAAQALWRISCRSNAAHVRGVCVVRVLHPQIAETRAAAAVMRDMHRRFRLLTAVKAPDSFEVYIYVCMYVCIYPM